MISILLILCRIHITKCTDSKTGKRIILSIDGNCLGHGSRHGIHNRAQIGITAKQGVLDLCLPLFYFRIRHLRLLIICQWLVILCRICVIQFRHLVDDVVVTGQEVFNLVINSLCIGRCGNRNCLAVI